MRLIHKIGVGSVQFGLPYGISNKNGKTPESEVTTILNFARENLMQVIDTASAYGSSEYILGQNNLHGFKVVSKFMPSDCGQTISEQLDLTLSDLRLEKIHGYLAHRPLELLNKLSDWEELKYLKGLHKVDKIGFSLNRPIELELLLEKNLIPDLVQVPYNFFDNRFKEYLIELHAQGCEIHTRSVFLQGIFFTNVNTLPEFFDSIKPNILSLQYKYGANLSKVLLKYVLMQEFIDHVIIGVENNEQLVQNIIGIDDVETIEDITNDVHERVLMPAQWPKIKL